MTLLEAIDAYITLKRSLGAVFSADTRILRSFARALGDIAVEDIDPTTTREFCRGNGAPTRWWERKDEALRGFFAWLVIRVRLRPTNLSPAFVKPCNARENTTDIGFMTVAEVVVQPVDFPT